jgi:Uma2 family endonuclease
MTADEFLQCEDGGGFELIDGVREENPMGFLSSWLGGELHALLRNFVHAAGIGFVAPQETGIAAWPDNPRLVCKPDAMFIRKERLPGGKLPTGWLTVAPDLAAEIVSPGDEAEYLDRKLADYRAARIPLVWVIYPGTRTALVYRGSHVQFIDTDDVLDGGDVLPGFSLPLADLFAAAGDAL